MSEILNQTINETVVPLFLGKTIPILSSPVLDILFLAMLGALFTTLVNKYLGDQVKIKALRADMKKLQKKIREVMKKDPQKAQQLQAEVMKKNFENMKHTMNPKIMIVTMAPMLILLWFIRTHYTHLGEFLNLGFTHFGWLGTYLTCSIICSIIFKKVFDVA